MSSLLLLGTGGGGAAPAFDPGAEPSLETWQKADGQKTIGSGPPFLVSDWGETGLTDTAVQATEARKPEFFSSFEGAEAVFFDGSDDRMRAALLALAAPATIAIRCKIPTSILFNDIFSLGSNFAVGTNAHLQRGSNTFPAPGFVIRCGEGGTPHVNASIFTLDTWFNYVFHLNTSTPFFQLFEDGAEELFATQPTGAHSGNGDFDIGTAASFFLDGYVREVMVFSSIVSQSDINTYLTNRWPA